MWDNHQALNFVANWLFALAALAAGYFFGQWAVNSSAFPLEEVSVDGGGGGLKQVTREQINEVVGSSVRGNFLTVDLEATRKAFAELPWVRAASVRRTWPRGLDVTLEEHIALARWGSDALVSTYGEVFSAVSDKKLPVLEGPIENSSDMVRQYAVFTRLLRPLQQNIDRVSLSDRRAWQVRLENGTVLELGREQMEARLARYVRVHDLSAGQLMGRLSHVDLRYPSGFAAR